MRTIRILSFIVFCGVAFGQATPKFEIASVHASEKIPNPLPRLTPLRDGRYEIHTASMVDLIQTAWGFAPDKILGGPSWLEMDRFDVVAKAPDKTSPADLKLMLQSLLAERFKLVVRQESRPLPSYALRVGKKPLLKQADGTGDTGCRMQAPPAATAQGDGPRIFMNGGAVALGPGGTIQYSCRNMTMEAFASGLGRMLGAGVLAGNNPVADKTGLQGSWNFDVKWSIGLNIGAAQAADNISVSDALEKQLGLKLEQEQVETPVLVVESANETPTADSPDAAKALPAIPLPRAFEVADIKPCDPDVRESSMSMQVGGRFTARGMSVRTLVLRALGSTGGLGMNQDAVVGVPAWADSARFDITAKAPADGPPINLVTMAPLLRSLLEERFGLKSHTEERPVVAYALVAVKPKMKKADPASRAHCIRSNGPSGSAPGTQVLTCQNFTMAQLADQLRNQAPGLTWPILDSTGLEGGWDFVLTFSNNLGGPGAAPAENGGPAAASDPSGSYTLFEAIERQLGLKLEMQKRQEPVTVIDHLEEKPTDN